jgi:hypothetical protein
MKLIPDEEERANLTHKLSSMLRVDIEDSEGITKAELAAFTVFGNAMLLIHTHEIEGIDELRHLSKTLKGLLSEARVKKIGQGTEQIIELVLALIEERATDATFEYKQ